MSTHTKEKLTVCICAGTSKHLTASIKRMGEDGWQESGHRSYHPEGDWHWQHMSKENPLDALREVQDAVRMLIMRASSEMKRFPVSEQVKRREHIERARKALAALSPQPTATEEGQG